MLSERLYKHWMELLEHLIQEDGNWKEYIQALPTERVLGLDELCSLIDVGINGKMCDRVGIVRVNYRRRKLPEVRRFAGTTSSGAWRHTLGMSTLPDYAAAASLLYCQAVCSDHCGTPVVQVRLSLLPMLARVLAKKMTGVLKCDSRRNDELELHCKSFQTEFFVGLQLCSNCQNV